MRLGLLMRKPSDRPTRQLSSHRASRPASRAACHSRTCRFCRRTASRYACRPGDREGLFMVIQLLPNGLKISVERLCVPTLQRGKPPKLCKVVDIFHHGGPGTEHENAV